MVSLIVAASALAGGLVASYTQLLSARRQRRHELAIHVFDEKKEAYAEFLEIVRKLNITARSMQKIRPRIEEVAGVAASQSEIMGEIRAWLDSLHRSVNAIGVEAAQFGKNPSAVSPGSLASYDDRLEQLARQAEEHRRQLDEMDTATESAKDSLAAANEEVSQAIEELKGISELVTQATRQLNVLTLIGSRQATASANRLIVAVGTPAYEGQLARFIADVQRDLGLRQRGR
jgi:chromosome segregation ATPase